MIGVAYIPTFSIPTKHKCDECNQRFLDDYAIEIRGHNSVLYLHSKCAREFAFGLDIAINQAIFDSKRAIY